MTGRVPLLDVNVLVALAWPNHIHHARAHAWFPRAGAWATCPLTQSGFVRVSSNRKAIPDARTPGEAIALLREIVALPGHVFWEDGIAITDARHGTFEHAVTHRHVTNAHLLALAISHDGSLATFRPRGPGSRAGRRRSGVGGSPAARDPGSGGAEPASPQPLVLGSARPGSGYPWLRATASPPTRVESLTRRVCCTLPPSTPTD